MNTPDTPRTVAVMQPYLFPYIGYFQLAAGADRFVFCNDLKFINKGWINRNRLRVNNEPWMFTVPLHRPSMNGRIDEAQVRLNDHFLRKFLLTIRQSYAKAPYLDVVVSLCEAVFDDPPETIDQLASRSVRQVMSYLGLPFDSCDAKGRYGNEALRREERVIDIVKKEQGTRYLNLPGGKELYFEDQFTAAGLELEFIEPVNEPYRQSGEPFIPYLSILDVLLWNDRDTVRGWLQ